MPMQPWKDEQNKNENFCNKLILYTPNLRSLELSQLT